MACAVRAIVPSTWGLLCESDRAEQLVFRARNAFSSLATLARVNRGSNFARLKVSRVLAQAVCETSRWLAWAFCMPKIPYLPESGSVNPQPIVSIFNNAASESHPLTHRYPRAKIVPV